ncbi:MAG: hypothetical protein HC865_09860, partial [Cyanobacteria bacterium RU_5_0]|nr:hypothetical protein [Cyanobacteria bacterium RU_5_0]
MLNSIEPYFPRLHVFFNSFRRLMFENHEDGNPLKAHRQTNLNGQHSIAQSPIKPINLKAMKVASQLIAQLQKQDSDRALIILEPGQTIPVITSLNLSQSNNRHTRTPILIYPSSKPATLMVATPEPKTNITFPPSPHPP